MGRPHDRVCPHRGRPRFERSPVLSSNYRNAINRQMPEYVQPPPQPDLQVAGPLNPPANGLYYKTGILNGDDYFRRRDGQWFLWFDDSALPVTYKWKITQSLGVSTPVAWTKSHGAALPPEGTYTPEAGVTGTAIVTVV